jgi:protein-S-isoprenylcysteine O-methyltransferase Ste14
MELIGKATIHPLIFYTGKIAGYLTWINSFLMLCGIELIDKKTAYFNNYISAFLLFVGLLFTVISLVNLGKSTRLGIPSDDTVMKTNGIYKISRNPMYVGFNLITITSMIYSLNWIVIILGVYSLITYHLIIKGEEDFMIRRFGNDYKIYQSKVRRYL